MKNHFLRSHKGRHEPSVKGRKRGGKATKRGLSNEQVAVLVARDRYGSTADFILEADNKKHVVTALKPIPAAIANRAAGLGVPPVARSRVRNQPR